MPAKKLSVALSPAELLDPSNPSRPQLVVVVGRPSSGPVSVWCLRDGMLTQYLVTVAVFGSRVERAGWFVPPCELGLWKRPLIWLACVRSLSERRNVDAVFGHAGGIWLAVEVSGGLSCPWLLRFWTWPLIWLACVGFVSARRNADAVFGHAGSISLAVRGERVIRGRVWGFGDEQTMLC